MKVFDLDGKLMQEAEDVLYEIGNVGVATAVIPIGNIREMEFRVGIPNVFSVEKDIFSQIEYSPEEVVVGVNTKMCDSMNGSILFLLSMEFVHNTIEIMLDEKVEDAQLLEDEECVSALQEFINYMTAGYVKVMGSYLNTPMFISAAAIGIEPVKDILKRTMMDMNQEDQRVACVNTKFSVVDQDGNKTNEKGQILIFPENESIEGLIKIMENKAE